MTTHRMTTAHSVSDRLRQILSAPGAALARFFSAVRAAHEMERLMTMGDRELARHGLRRDEIVRHVLSSMR